MASWAPRLLRGCVLLLLGCSGRAAATPLPSAPQAPAAARVAADARVAPVAPLDIPEIDRLVREAIAARNLPGCVVAVGRRDGITFLRAYGERQLVPLRAAMTEDTIFDLASLSKPVATAASVLLLAERGKLRLEDQAYRFLPELDRKATRAITVRDLLLHTAGLPIEDPLRDFAAGPGPAVAAMLAHDPVTPRGRFVYSDLGYLWLGELVGRVSGKPLDAFARDELFGPLGMHDTGYNPAASLLPRIAPTEVVDDRPEAAATPLPPSWPAGQPPSPWHPGGPYKLIHGVVHDPRAYRLGGVAGNAGLFSTALDLSRFARMLLGAGSLEGVRVMSAGTVERFTQPVNLGDSVRALGWDVRSRYSRSRGTLLSPRAFGHGGFTGTSLFVDPERDLFVVLLSNRVHPDGKGSVIALSGAIADAAVRALERARGARSPAHPVETGIDVLRRTGFARLKGKRVGLLTHVAARGADGETTLSIFEHAPAVLLRAVFSPEHGLDAEHEGSVADARASRSVPVYSLYGKTRRPSAEMLAGLDVVVIDLVDVGVRFFTYMSTLHAMLQAAAEAGVPVLVLDRPNPLGGEAVEGPMLDPSLRSFVNHYPLPIRHGLSAGELAWLINDQERIGAQLEVIEASGWCREQLFDQTGLHWNKPSPNLPSFDAALLYPAVGLLEGTNLSVGRGTEHPFSQLGAPWIDAPALARRVSEAKLPGVTVEPTTFTPTRGPYAMQRCSGLRLQVQDPRAFRPVRTGLEIARALLELHRARFDTDKLIELLGDRPSLQGLLAAKDIATLERGWQSTLERFLALRRGYLRYPSCAQNVSAVP
ncbi:MAG: exo-beta-N-acetylmuramidase NamZ domain-containing protein [Polyangiales bacterium]